MQRGRGAKLPSAKRFHMSHRSWFCARYTPRTFGALRALPQVRSGDSPYANEDLNLRCYYNPSFSYDVANRYLKGFRLLRQGNEQLVVFAAITGVPTDLVDAKTLSAVDFTNDAIRDQFYDNILNDPRMMETIDPATNPGTGSGNLKPSCVLTDAQGNLETAQPPRWTQGVRRSMTAKATTAR